jgi:hypothetical protein
MAQKINEGQVKPSSVRSAMLAPTIGTAIRSIIVVTCTRVSLSKATSRCLQGRGPDDSSICIVGPKYLVARRQLAARRLQRSQRWHRCHSHPRRLPRRRHQHLLPRLHQNSLRPLRRRVDSRQNQRNRLFRRKVQSPLRSSRRADSGQRIFSSLRASAVRLCEPTIAFCNRRIPSSRKTTIPAILRIKPATRSVARPRGTPQQPRRTTKFHVTPRKWLPPLREPARATAFTSLT